jgi:hypothetical protein
MDEVLERDGLPPVSEVIDALQKEEFPDDRPVDRVIVHVLASGECPYRLYLRGTDDYEAGILTLAVPTPAEGDAT